MLIKLYTGPHCELCDQAKELIYPFTTRGIELDEIDVTQDLEIKKRYGLHIPVLVKPNGEELGWPFSREDLESFLTCLD